MRSNLVCGGLLAIVVLAGQFQVSGQSARIPHPTLATATALQNVTWHMSPSAAPGRQRHPTQWKRGALIGAVIGAGAWIAINLSQGCGGSGSDSDCVVWAVGLSPVFGLLGAIPGALVGGLFPKKGEQL